MTYQTISSDYRIISATEFNRRIEEGIRRAPFERAKALKAFFSLFYRT
jgi:hypothetical protein